MILSKFVSNDLDKIKTILDRKIWLSPPEKFNDINDCRLHSVYSDFISADLRRDLINFAGRYGAATASDQRFLHHIKASLMQILLNSDYPHELCNASSLSQSIVRNSAVSEIRKFFRNKIGVSCFLEGVGDDLMWAHYGAGYSGVCFEFEVPDDISDDLLLPVCYSSLAPTISVNEFLFATDATVNRIVSTKNICWAYEKEWRIIRPLDEKADCGGMAIDLPEWMSIKKVIFGSEYKKNHDFDFSSLGVELVKYRSPYRT